MYDKVGSDYALRELRRYCESSSRLFQAIGESRRNSKVYDVFLSAKPSDVRGDDLRFIYTDVDNLYKVASSLGSSGTAVFVELPLNKESGEWIYCEEADASHIYSRSTLLFCIQNNEKLKELYSCDGYSMNEAVKCLYLPKVIFFEEQKVSDSTDALFLDVIAVDRKAIDVMTQREHISDKEYDGGITDVLRSLLSVVWMKTIDTIVYVECCE